MTFSNILKYLSGSEPGLRHEDQRGLADVGLGLQTMVDQERAGADVGVRKAHQRIEAKLSNLKTGSDLKTSPLKRYDEPLFHAAKLTEEAPPFTDFALFLKKNSSLEADLPMYTMYTGEGDPYKLATIQSFNGVEEMDHWNASECNKVMILQE